MNDLARELYEIVRESLDVTKDTIAEIRRIIDNTQAQIDMTNEYIKDIQSYQDTTIKENKNEA